MLSLFKNKSLGAEQVPSDPRVRLLAQIEYQESIVRTTELKVRAELTDRATLDRQRAELTRLNADLARLEAAEKATNVLAKQRAEHAPALLAEQEAASADLDAALSQLEAAIAKAEATGREIDKQFNDAGKVVAPFDSTMLEKLFFWNRGTLVMLPGFPQREYGVFADKLAEFRQIGQPPRPPAVLHREPVDEPARAKRRRAALQSSKLTSRMVEGVGVVVEARQ